MLNSSRYVELISSVRFSSFVVRFFVVKSFFVMLSISFFFGAVLYPFVVVVTPAVSAVVVLLFGRYMSRVASLVFVTFPVFLSFIGSLAVFVFVSKIDLEGWEISNVYSFVIAQWESWLHVPYSAVSISFLLDDLSVGMLVLVTCVSFFVHVYSVNYMYGDPSLVRFLAYLSLFTFFMLVLASAPNFIQFFLGWEGVGLMSYLLVGFWSDRQQASKSAWKALFVNRVGDFTFLLCIAVNFFLFGTFDFFDVFAQLQGYVFSSVQVLACLGDLLYFFFVCVQDELFLVGSLDQVRTVLILLAPYFYVEVIVLLLFVSAMAKSAQLGLHSWLPDAMEGPTPVSALIHAATMVTAGVYLLLRCAPLLSLSFLAPYYMAFFGALTCLYAGILACVQSDVKKLVAYSTMSQLGYMVLGCSGLNYFSSFFHLWIHGYMKALLFLGVGVVIHLLGDEQSSFKMGGLGSLLPFVFSVILVGSASLVALPLFSGYFSKEPIIELACSDPRSGLGVFVYLSGVLGAIFTGFYCVKLAVLTFLGEPAISRSAVRVVFWRHKQPFVGFWVLFGLLGLALASAILGEFFVDLFRTYRTGFSVCLGQPPFTYCRVVSGWKMGCEFFDFLTDNEYGILYYIGVAFYVVGLHVFRVVSFEEYEFFGPTGLPVFAALLGGVASFVAYRFSPVLALSKFKFSAFNSLRYVLGRKFYFDKIVNVFVSRRSMLSFYRTFWLALDKGLLEFFGPTGLIAVVGSLNRALSRMQTGSIVTYLSIIAWASASFFFLYSLFLA